MTKPLEPWDGRASVEERRDAILRSLGSSIREKRLSSLTMSDIAHRLGLVKGNLYYYFKSKQDIFYHCHVKCMEISLAALEQAEGMQAPPSQRLRALLVGHICGITEEPYGGVLLTDLENLTPPQRGRYVKMRDEFEAGVRRLIQDGVVCGEFREQNVRLSAFAILGAINWIPKWFRSEGPASASEVAAAFADQLVRSLKP